MGDVVRLSLFVSLTAVAIASAIAIPLASFVSVSRFRGRNILVALIYTGFALPPVVVGLFVYMLLSRSGPLGGLDLLFTPTAMILSQAIISFPYVLGVSLAAIEAIPAEVVLQARALGASRWRAIYTRLREARFGIVASVVAGFGAAISEVGSVLLVGGNVQGETRVLTGTIMLETRRGNFGPAIAMGLILLGLVFMVNAALMFLSKSGSTPRAREGQR